MYFAAFPLTYYSLENDASNVKVVTNITQRVTLSDELKNNYGLYDEYDIKDGETPEIIADKFYNNPQLHWIVLHTNDILDPRYDWLLPYDKLVKFCEGKYANVNGTHHFEDSNSNYVVGNVYLFSSNEFSNLETSNVITNISGTGTGYIAAKNNNSNIIVNVTVGGFNAGDVLSLAGNSQVNANITSTEIITGTPITNLIYEDRVNESKRKIKILKPQYVNNVVNDFKKKLELK